MKRNKLYKRVVALIAEEFRDKELGELHLLWDSDPHGLFDAFTELVIARCPDLFVNPNKDEGDAP